MPALKKVCLSEGDVYDEGDNRPEVGLIYRFRGICRKGCQDLLQCIGWNKALKWSVNEISETERIYTDYSTPHLQENVEKKV
jgi:hypothetical protein